MHTERQKEHDLQLERDDEWLDEALRETFPASDPIPSVHREPQPGKRSGENPPKRIGTGSADD
ncbi:hypothetical protein [Povalibacter sp.]|uniref:hypothetical protein n=1 Tax=Povalibacter sp. TaxID=1962978 RepID=UPI002F400B1B